MHNNSSVSEQRAGRLGGGSREIGHLWELRPEPGAPWG